MSTQFDGPIVVIGSGVVNLGEHCRIGRHVQFETEGDAVITLGDRVRINTGGVLVANTRVSIGDDTLVGEYVSIRDANHGTAAGYLIRTQPLVAEAIVIGRDVWIGRGACVLKGVTVGDSAVVGANSVVTSDVAAYSIVVGVPARHIGDRKPGQQPVPPTRESS